MKAFNAIAGYKSNFIIQGFMHLRGEHLAVIEQQYSSMEELLKAYSTDVSEELPKPDEKLYVNIADDIKPIFRNDAHLVPKESALPVIRTTGVKKIDHLKKNKSNAITGSKGEAFVVIAERERLTRAGRVDLAEKVKRVSLTDDSLGYDVLSYDANGLERCIEVKASGAKQETVRFYMSANEMLKSKILENYYIYYIDSVNTTQPRIISIKYPFDKRFLISTDTYLLQASIDKL